MHSYLHVCAYVHLLQVLLERWELAPLSDPSRHALLSMLGAAVLPRALAPASALGASGLGAPRPRGVNESNDEGVPRDAADASRGTPALPPELALRWLRSLPKLLWQARPAFKDKYKYQYTYKY